jgi:hypothetical protein
MAKPQPAEAMCLIELNGAYILLSAKDAADIFPILCKGEVLEYDWNAKGYKRKKIDVHNVGVTLKQFTVEQYAVMTLNSDQE